MRKTNEVQVLVPLEDLYQPGHPGATAVSMLPADTEDYLKRTYGVTVHRDHRYRMAVTLEDAYKIRDARQSAAEQMHAENMAKMSNDEAVGAWQRARDTYWAINWIHVARQTPRQQDPQQHASAARARLGEMVLAAEATAGIPNDIQSRLTWPSHLSWTELENGADHSYVPPKLDQEGL